MRRRFLLLTMISFAAVISCEKKEKDRCTDFKTGTFRFVKPELKRFKVVRDNREQVETDSVTGLTIRGNVKWTSDCSYKVTYTKVSDSNYSSVVGATSNVKILAIFDNKLTCKSEGLGGTMEVEMIKTDR